MIWSLVRLRLDRPEFGRYNAFGRLAFSAWIVNAIVAGAGPVVWLFLCAEIAWALVQLPPVRAPVAA